MRRGAFERLGARVLASWKLSGQAPLGKSFWSKSEGLVTGRTPLLNPSARWQNLSRSEGRGHATKAEEYDLITGDDQMARVDGHDAKGFLVNKVYLPGPVLCSGRLTALWAAPAYDAITIESLSLLMLMKPPPDLLLLGCGGKMLPPPVDVQKWLASHGVALECLSTANAASTFNILNQEGRAVVGAFLPSE